MLVQMIPDGLRTLLLGACCLALLAGCDAGLADARADEGGPASFAVLPSAEREARHYDLYIQYRAGFDRPRHAYSGALQDDGDQPTLQDAMLWLSSAAAACITRGSSGD